MPRKTVPIYQDDDFEQLSELRLEVAVAERELTQKRLESLMPAPLEVARLGDPPVNPLAELEEQVAEKRAAVDAFIDQAADRADGWDLHHIGHEAWIDLVAAHPERKITVGEGEEAKEVPHPTDEHYGVNTDTFGTALLLFVDPDDEDHRTIAKVGGRDRTAIRGLVRRLSQGQLDTLWLTAWQLNTGAVVDPKLWRYSSAPRSIES